MELGSMEDLERRLKEYRSGKGTASSTSAGRVEPEPVISQSSQLRGYKQDGRSDDPVQRKIDAYLRESYVVQVSPEFAKYESVTTDLRPVKYDFLDKELMGRAGIVLERYDNKFIAELGRSVIPMMSSGLSKMGMAALFVLAYHLKKPLWLTSRQKHVQSLYISWLQHYSLRIQKQTYGNIGYSAAG